MNLKDADKHILNETYSVLFRIEKWIVFVKSAASNITFVNFFKLRIGKFLQPRSLKAIRALAKNYSFLIFFLHAHTKFFIYFKNNFLFSILH